MGSIVFYDNFKAHRVAAGIKIAEMAKSSDVSEATIRRIEKHYPSTKETINKIINALNETSFYKIRQINSDIEISDTSKFGLPNVQADASESL